MSASASGGPSGKFEYGDVAGAANSLVKGSKGVLFLWGLLAAVVGGVLGWVLGPDPFDPQLMQVVVMDVVSAFLGGVVLVGAVTAGLIRAAGERLTFGALFRHMNRLPDIWLVLVPLALVEVYLPQALGNWVQVVLLVLTAPLALWPYFVIDGGENGFTALFSSYEVVLNNLGAYLKYLLLVLLMFAPTVSIALIGVAVDAWQLALIGLGLMLVSMIWLVPFMVIAQWLMYSRAVGLQRDYSEA